MGGCQSEVDGLNPCSGFPSGRLLSQGLTPGCLALNPIPDHGVSLRGNAPRRIDRGSRCGVQTHLDCTPCSPGLNVHSMLKHQTLVLTLQTVAFLEEKLLWHDSRYTPLYPFHLPYSDFP